MWAIFDVRNGNLCTEDTDAEAGGVHMVPSPRLPAAPSDRVGSGRPRARREKRSALCQNSHEHIHQSGRAGNSSIGKG